MSHISPKILEIRGRERLEAGLSHLRVVADGGKEGAVPKFRDQAADLLAVSAGLNDHRRAQIRAWLGKNNALSIEDALIRMKNRIEKENAQGKRHAR